MIFSNKKLSRFVRGNFLAAWENVRPVPVVEIDFGNGRKVKRTVNGNIATYICAPDGRVVDVIPGLYSAEAYLGKLREALALYRASLANFDKAVPGYHRARAIRAGVVVKPREDTGKYLVEGLLRAAIRVAAPKRADLGKELVEQPVRKNFEASALAADTEHNRREREPLVHAILAERVFRPAEITHRLYREVLHVDLDDPHLGLLPRAFDGGAYARR